MALSEFKANIIRETGYQSAIVKGFDVDIEESNWYGYHATIRLMFESDSDAMLFIAELSDTSLSELKIQIMASINDLPTAKQLIEGYHAGRVSECSDRDADPWDSINLDDSLPEYEKVQKQSTEQKTARDNLSLPAAKIYNAIVDLYASSVNGGPISLRSLAETTQLKEEVVYSYISVDLENSELVYLTNNDNIYLLASNDVLLTNVDQYKTRAGFKALFKSTAYTTKKAKEYAEFDAKVRDAREFINKISTGMVNVYNYIVSCSYQQTHIENEEIQADLEYSALNTHLIINSLIEMGLISRGGAQQVGRLMYGKDKKLLCGALLFDSESAYRDHFIIK